MNGGSTQREPSATVLRGPAERPLQHLRWSHERSLSSRPNRSDATAARTRWPRRLPPARTGSGPDARLARRPATRCGPLPRAHRGPGAGRRAAVRHPCDGSSVACPRRAVGPLCRSRPRTGPVGLRRVLPAAGAVHHPRRGSDGALGQRLLDRAGQRGSAGSCRGDRRRHGQLPVERAAQCDGCARRWSRHPRLGQPRALRRRCYQWRRALLAPWLRDRRPTKDPSRLSQPAGSTRGRPASVPSRWPAHPLVLGARQPRQPPAGDAASERAALDRRHRPLEADGAASRPRSV